MGSTQIHEQKFEYNRKHINVWKEVNARPGYYTSVDVELIPMLANPMTEQQSIFYMILE